MKSKELNFLVVEDNEFQRELLISVLKSMGARNVWSASDGAKALDIVLKAKPMVDVVVTDLAMPTMDGLELVRRAGEGGYSGSVLITSALDSPLLAAAEAMSKAYGVNLLGAVSKPVTRQVLEAALVRHGAPEPKLHVPASARTSFTPDEILEALARDEFEPFFQPKVELASRKVIGAEALARWRHPERGIALPGTFVKVLEDAGRIDDLMWVMLRKAIVFCGTLNSSGMKTTVAVNLSLKSLSNPELAGRIAAMVERHNLDPSRVCLELTESAATTNLGAALENLTRLRMVGFGLSIDDFGTGYSSMQQLTRIPFTELKIDRSFVTNSATHETSRVMLTSCLQIARQLKLKAVAEGVETHEEWNLLQELGCDLAQGYFIARPMDAKTYVEWIRDLTATPTSMFTSPIVAGSTAGRRSLG